MMYEKSMIMYIKTSINGPSVMDGSYSYVIEWEAKNGKKCTFTSTGFEKETTVQRLNLLALIRGMDHITKPSRISIITEYRGVLDEVKKGSLDRWKRNGWKKADGTTVKNADLWQQLEERLQIHGITKWKHPYADWMEDEIRKEMERHKESG